MIYNDLADLGYDLATLPKPLTRIYKVNAIAKTFPVFVKMTIDQMHGLQIYPYTDSRVYLFKSKIPVCWVCDRNLARMMSELNIKMIECDRHYDEITMNFYCS